jgi:hypothetical protein
MSMMDLAGALAPPGAPPGPMGPAPMGPEPPMGEPPLEEPPPEEGGSSIDFLDDAEAALQEFIRIDPDEVDRAEAGKALQIVLKLKAANQTSAQAGDMKSLRRALAPAGGGPLG